MYQYDVHGVSGSIVTGDLRHRFIGWVEAETKAEAERVVVRHDVAARLQPGERMRVFTVGLYIERPGRIG